MLCNFVLSNKKSIMYSYSMFNFKLPVVKHPIKDLKIFKIYKR